MAESPQAWIARAGVWAGGGLDGKGGGKGGAKGDGRGKVGSGRDVGEQLYSLHEFATSTSTNDNASHQHHQQEEQEEREGEGSKSYCGDPLLRLIVEGHEGCEAKRRVCTSNGSGLRAMPWCTE